MLWNRLAIFMKRLRETYRLGKILSNSYFHSIIYYIIFKNPLHLTSVVEHDLFYKSYNSIDAIAYTFANGNISQKFAHSYITTHVLKLMQVLMIFSFGKRVDSGGFACASRGIVTMRSWPLLLPTFGLSSLFLLRLVFDPLRGIPWLKFCFPPLFWHS